ncbi:MAG TPA: cob(I)alamin adenolsyltransferase [Phycisphaerales bacterium]|nr:cob(I)alamin adenolsyltransferase [Phycisphaerales bacterium]
MKQPPRILLFTGDGKGKTTAALGLAFRAIGCGMKVCVIQFIKSAPAGEVQTAKAVPGMVFIGTGLGFLPPKDDPSFVRHRAAVMAGLEKASQAIASGRFEMVVLDEICVAVNRGFLQEPHVIELLRRAPSHMVLVLTGRGATEGLVQLADTVTEMHCVKHALAAGWQAQKGVEL